MSILSSTNTGRNGVKVNAALLEKYGYFSDGVPGNEIFFCKENKWIKCKKSNDNFEFMIRINNDHLYYSSSHLLSYFVLENIDDLILADKYLFSNHNSKEFKKYKKQILKINAKRLVDKLI